MVDNRQRHILLVFPPTRISRVDKMRGIFRFISETRNWTIDICQGELSSKAIDAADGIIATGMLSPLTISRITKSNMPTVFIEIENDRRRNVSDIISDPDEFARVIADYFANRGIYREFMAITGHSPHGFHLAVTTALRRIMKSRHISCKILSSATQMTFQRLPLAVFTCNDDIAAEAVNFAIGSGLRIPHELAVLGFSNDTVICENHRPSLSSIEPDFELQGYLAAKELDRIISAKKPTFKRTLTVGVKQIAERESSALPESGYGLIRQALAFIEANACQPLTVMDVVQHLGVSRRLVELRFRERYHRSVLETIRYFKLEITCRKLRESNDTIAKICEKCGWKSESLPKKMFRRMYHTTMREYRKNLGPHSRTPLGPKGQGFDIADA